jgi:hypothetical protein
MHVKTLCIPVWTAPFPAAPEISFENWVDAQVPVENPRTEQAGVATCLICIVMVPGWRPGRDTNCRD